MYFNKPNKIGINVETHTSETVLDLGKVATKKGNKVGDETVFFIMYWSFFQF